MAFYKGSTMVAGVGGGSSGNISAEISALSLDLSVHCVQLSSHDADVKNQLSSHDTDVKTVVNSLSSTVESLSATVWNGFSDLSAKVAEVKSVANSVFDYANLVYKDNIGATSYSTIIFESSEITADGQVRMEIYGTIASASDYVSIAGTSITFLKTLGSTAVINPALTTAMTDSASRLITVSVKKGQRVIISLSNSGCGAAYLPYASA